MSKKASEESGVAKGTIVPLVFSAALIGAGVQEKARNEKGALTSAGHFNSRKGRWFGFFV